MSAIGSPGNADQRERALIGEVAVLLAADRTPRETFASLCQLLARLIDVSVCFVALRSGGALCGSSTSTITASNAPTPRSSSR